MQRLATIKTWSHLWTRLTRNKLVKYRQDHGTDMGKAAALVSSEKNIAGVWPNASGWMQTECRSSSKTVRNPKTAIVCDRVPICSQF